MRSRCMFKGQGKMLVEIPNVSQVKGEPRRRWFNDSFFDLVLWLDDADDIIGFQLSYDKSNNERALTWDPVQGYLHHGVDDGEGRPGKRKATPILVADGEFQSEQVAEAFQEASADVDPYVAAFVYEKLHLAFNEPTTNGETSADDFRG